MALRCLSFVSWKVNPVPCYDQGDDREEDRVQIRSEGDDSLKDSFRRTVREDENSADGADAARATNALVDEVPGLWMMPDSTDVPPKPLGMPYSGWKGQRPTNVLLSRVDDAGAMIDVRWRDDVPGCGICDYIRESFCRWLGFGCEGIFSTPSFIWKEKLELRFLQVRLKLPYTLSSHKEAPES
ncbi:hypothetical protein BJV78DRAFT_1153285 [Lactifluus subvellereus]|nr:hypothetical protein BJV78DRAFT_1153285 [Lactifluus subvellereus]